MSAVPQLQPVTSFNREKLFASETVSRIAIGHALVDNCTYEQAIAAVLTHASTGDAPAYVLTPNAQHIVLLRCDERLRDIYRHAHLVVADGFSLLIAASLFGASLKERVPGVDLFQSICAGAAKSGLRVFFLGGRPGSADLAAAKLATLYPGIQIQTDCPPFGFEQNPAELERINRLIRAAQPHILFVGLGAPKQEYWIYDHGRHLGVNICMGIGGSFEMVGGVVRRAPVPVRTAGLEWLFRLCMEPRRMWRRYLVGNAQFIKIVLDQHIHVLTLRTLLKVLKRPSSAPALHDAGLRTEAQAAIERLTLDFGHSEFATAKLKDKAHHA